MNPVHELSSKEFPALLGEIPEPPEKLFLRGKLPSPELIPIAVVGSRNATPYGRDAVKTIIAGLRGYPIAIISGLALGIDSYAHRAALDAGLYTLAVPGSGLSDDVIYPRNHLSLAHEILEKGGGLLSEYEPDFKATQWSFPQRNRIMAGIAKAVLVIEAEEKSGSLITARLALDYNRDVWAVPGSIYSSNSSGTNKLIARGATVITSAADVLDQLGLAEAAILSNPDNCSEDEQKLLAILSEPLSKDELCQRLSWSASKVAITVAGLEIQSLVAQSGDLIRRI